jgi:hypothetical protein
VTPYCAFALALPFSIGGAAMDGEQHNMTSREVYEKLRHFTIIKNEAKLEALLGPSWRQVFVFQPIS